MATLSGSAWIGAKLRWCGTEWEIEVRNLDNLTDKDGRCRKAMLTSTTLPHRWDAEQVMLEAGDRIEIAVASEPFRTAEPLTAQVTQGLDPTANELGLNEFTFFKWTWRE